MTDYITTYLSEKNAGVFGETLFRSTRPDTDGVPDNCIIVYDETGIVKDYQSDYNSDSAGLMVMARGNYTYAYSKIWECHNLICGLNGIETDDYYITATQVQSTPAQIDIDDRGRRIYTAHYIFTITRKANENRIPIT